MLFGKPLSQEQIAGMARILGPAIDWFEAKEQAERAQPAQPAQPAQREGRLGRLRELRLDAAMSQADLADRAGVARTTIARIETGSPRPILPSTIRKLAKALGVTPADLRRGS